MKPISCATKFSTVCFVTFNIFLVFILKLFLYAFLYLVVVPLRILSFSKESCHVTINKEVSKHDTETSMFSVSEAIL